MRTYPIQRPGEDPRFTMGLLLDVARLLKDRGFPELKEGGDLVALQEALFGFIYAPREEEWSREDDKRVDDVLQGEKSVQKPTAPIARDEIGPIVSALPVHGLLRLVIVARTLLDETRRMLAPGERELHARAELETIVAVLPADERARLGALGREVLEQSSVGPPDAAGG
jgi:hypothetical protein